MQRFLPIPAALALCCVLQAAPVRSFDHHDEPTVLTAIAVGSDLSLNSPAIGPSLANDDDADLVTTEIAFSDGASEDEFTVDATAAASVRVPEPPPVEMLLIGFLALGAIALWRRARAEKRRRRRHTLVRMRALTAIR